MSGGTSNRSETDSLLTDLEGWEDVLFCMSSAEVVSPNAIRMVSNMVGRCVRELRQATGTGPARTENKRCA